MGYWRSGACGYLGYFLPPSSPVLVVGLQYGSERGPDDVPTCTPPDGSPNFSQICGKGHFPTSGPGFGLG